jgi:hypothetical protein
LCDNSLFDATLHEFGGFFQPQPSRTSALPTRGFLLHDMSRLA